MLGHINLKERRVVDFPEDKIVFLEKVYLDQRKNIDIPFEIKLHIKDVNEQ